MSPPRYSATQLLQTATLTYRNAADTTESLGTQFPASNVGDSRCGTVAKFPRLELGSLVWQWSASKTWNCVAFLNHNLLSDVAHIVEKSSDGSAWTTVQSGVLLGSDRYWISFSDQSSTWGRVRLTGTGSQTAIPYYGEIWVGDMEALTRNHAFGVRVGRGFNNVGGKTTWGLPWKYHKNAYSKVTGVMADALSDAELAEVEALLEAIRGSGTPFLWVPDGAVATECWVAEYASDEWDAAQNAVGQHDALRMDIQEIPWGKPVA